MGSSVKALGINTTRHRIAARYPELLYLGLDVALREVLDVGQLEVHLSQPHQDAVAGRLELLPLADEVLGAGGSSRRRKTRLSVSFTFLLC